MVCVCVCVCVCACVCVCVCVCACVCTSADTTWVAQRPSSMILFTPAKCVANNTCNVRVLAGLLVACMMLIPCVCCSLWTCLVPSTSPPAPLWRPSQISSCTAFHVMTLMRCPCTSQRCAAIYALRMSVCVGVCGCTAFHVMTMHITKVCCYVRIAHEFCVCVCVCGCSVWVRVGGWVCVWV